jgi:CRISPR-associated protein Cas1
MQLYLDSFGAYLSVKNGQFRVRLPDEQVHLFAARNVNAILLTKGTGLSTDAALLALEYDIPVLLIDAQTHFPLGQLSGGRPGNISTVRKNQPEFCRSATGFAWAGACLARKIRGQRAVLEHLAGKPGVSADFKTGAALAGKVMADLQTRLETAETESMLRAELAEKYRGQEGSASRVYFQKLADFLSELPDESLFRQEEGAFLGRMKRPAFDPFNALLNYLYGMLYTSCHLALLKNGLDPYLAVLHADRYGDRPTLVYDFIEPYRSWADHTALELAASGSVQEDWFEPDPDERGLWMSKTGKSAVVEAMLDHLETPTEYGGRQVKRRVQIDLDAQKLAGLVKG